MTYLNLLFAILLIAGLAYGAFRIGQAFPRVALLLSGLSFCIVACLWFFIFMEREDSLEYAIWAGRVVFIALIPMSMGFAFFFGAFPEFANMMPKIPQSNMPITPNPAVKMDASPKSAAPRPLPPR